MLGVARRGDEADGDFGGAAVAVRKLQREALHAARARGEITGQLREQPPGGEQQRLGLRDFGGQFDAGGEPGRRREKAARVGKPPARAVEIVEQCLAETARQAVARQREQIADGGGTDRLQGFERIGVAAQDSEGQRRYSLIDPRGLGDQSLLAGAGEPAGGARSRRDGETGREAHG